MRWTFRIVGALLRGSLTFCTLMLTAWLWLMSPSGAERETLGLSVEGAGDNRQQIAVMRMARGLLAVAPDATVAALLSIAPAEMSAADLRLALQAVADGEAGRGLDLQGGDLDTFTRNDGSPERSLGRAISGAKFLRPPAAVSR